MSNEHEHGHDVNYIAVAIALAVFSMIAVAVDAFKFENNLITIVLVMAIAVAKATCVLMFFMHLKFEGNWKYVLLAPTTILAIGLPIALFPDIGTSYYSSLAPQAAWAEEMPLHHGSHHDSLPVSHDGEAESRTGGDNAAQENDENAPAPEQQPESADK